MEDTTVDADGTHDFDERRPDGLLRSRPLVLTLSLCLMVFLIGAASMSEVSTNYADMAKIVGVVAFIGSMVALALNMVGDAYRS